MAWKTWGQSQVESYQNSKMVLDASLLNTQHYKVRLKGKEEQSRERSSAPLYLGVVAIEKGANFTLLYFNYVLTNLPNSIYKQNGLYN